jgi:hypothetical protein
MYMCTVTTHNTFIYGLPTKTKLQNGKPPYPYSKICILILISNSLSLYQNPYPYHDNKILILIHLLVLGTETQ